ncbi:hypothetical protein [Silvibacterium dinghuense]|uniref:hypothetical protein n=1 Tax=Silvibacterium dinghuense TaxID=1560006 RepID=UPI0019A4D56B|nr:hypothetical protein GCM10011586_21090 [Silvibacterium dinghuense]
MTDTVLNTKLQTAAREAGLVVLSTETGADFHKRPTARYRLAATPDADPKQTLTLELSEDFDFDKPALLPELTQHLKEEARRLQNPRPDVYVTQYGVPVQLTAFQWPFHQSTSGADSYIVHGTLHLEDGTDSPLHAKIAAAVTVTFAEVLTAMEQPYAESFLYNAIRKTLDQGQLELLKSGNRQPVPVTTRYYSRWKKTFVFTDTTEQERANFLLLKVYWLSGVLGHGAPVWISDPRDAQYLNTTPADLEKIAGDLSRQGLISLQGDAATATPALMAQAHDFEEKLEKGIAITKPAFNEEMRAGHTNM